MRACVSSCVRTSVCECACLCVCIRGGVFVWVRMRVYVFEPMVVCLRMNVSSCVCLPFVSVCAFVGVCYVYVSLSTFVCVYVCERACASVRLFMCMGVSVYACV